MKNAILFCGIITILTGCLNDTPQRICVKYVKYAKQNDLESMKKLTYYNERLYSTAYIDSLSKLFCKNIKNIDLPEEQDIVARYQLDELIGCEYKVQYKFNIYITLIKLKTNEYKVCFADAHVFNQTPFPDSTLRYKPRPTN